MSSKVSELYMVLGEPDNGLLVAKVWLEKTGDLYVSRHAPAVLAGKDSYHESGLSHSDIYLIRRRTGLGQPRRDSLASVRRYAWVAGWGCPMREEPNGYGCHDDTKHRKTVVLPVPPLGWYFQCWAIEPGRYDLAKRIAETDPWPTVKATASVLGDWGNPWLLLTLAEWTNNQPYQVIRYAPILPGRVPFIMLPRDYEGTWLETPAAKWRPGEPFPDEWIKESIKWEAQQARNAARGIPHSRPLP